MKKITTFLVSLLALIGLVGCGSSNSNKVDNSSNDKEIAKNWFGTSVLEYETTAINEFKAGKAHFEVCLPKDIPASLRLNVGELDDKFNSKDQKLSVSYTSTSNLTEKDYKNFIAMLVADDVKAKIKTATEFVPNDKQVVDVPVTDDFLANTTAKRVVATIYMPVHIKYVKYKKDDSALTTLYTYMLVPLKSVATTKDEGGNFADTVINEYKDKTATFTLKKGIIQ